MYRSSSFNSTINFKFSAQPSLNKSMSFVTQSLISTAFLNNSQKNPQQLINQLNYQSSGGASQNFICGKKNFI